MAKQMDLFGAAALIGFSLLMAFNQVVIKVSNEGFQPVFFAGLRSAGAVICLLIWMRWRGLSVRIPREIWPAALLIGLVFTVEFILLFVALDLTTVTRSSVIYYSMPVWLGLAAHFIIPGERLTLGKLSGLVIAFGGVVLAIVAPSDDLGGGSLLGDLCALAASIGWAGIVLCARATRISQTRPEVQLFYQVLISAPLLLIAALWFGPFIRELEPIHIAGLIFQILVVVTVAFILWLWLLSIYRAASVASFSFLSPIFGVAMGWLILDEPVGVSLLISLMLVACGLVLINRA